MPRSNWAREPQLLSLRVWSLCSAITEAARVRGPRTAMKSGPRLPQLEKALAQKRRPNTAIKKKKKKKKENRLLAFDIHHSIKNLKILKIHYFSHHRISPRRHNGIILHHKLCCSHYNNFRVTENINKPTCAGEFPLAPKACRSSVQFGTWTTFLRSCKYIFLKSVKQPWITVYFQVCTHAERKIVEKSRTLIVIILEGLAAKYTYECIYKNYHFISGNDTIEISSIFLGLTAISRWSLSSYDCDCNILVGGDEVRKAMSTGSSGLFLILR